MYELSDDVRLIVTLDNRVVLNKAYMETTNLNIGWW